MRTLTASELSTISGNGYKAPSHDAPKGGYDDKGKDAHKKS